MCPFIHLFIHLVNLPRNVLTATHYIGIDTVKLIPVQYPGI